MVIRPLRVQKNKYDFKKMSIPFIEQLDKIFKNANETKKKDPLNRIPVYLGIGGFALLSLNFLCI